MDPQRDPQRVLMFLVTRLALFTWVAVRLMLWRYDVNFDSYEALREFCLSNPFFVARCMFDLGQPLPISLTPHFTPIRVSGPRMRILAPFERTPDGIMYTDDSGMRHIMSPSLASRIQVADMRLILNRLIRLRGVWTVTFSNFRRREFVVLARAGLCQVSVSMARVPWDRQPITVNLTTEDVRRFICRVLGCFDVAIDQTVPHAQQTLGGINDPSWMGLPLQWNLEAAMGPEIELPVHEDETPVDGHGPEPGEDESSGSVEDQDDASSCTMRDTDSV